MIELYDKDGNLVENVLTSDEVETKIQEEKTKLQEELETKRQDEVNVFLQEKEQLEAYKLELEQKLAGKDDKALNFKTLREKAESKDKQIEELNKKIDDLKGTFETKITELSTKQLEDIKSDLLSDISDKDTRDKVEFHYKSFTGVPSTKEEIKERIKNATILATGGRTKSFLSSSNISSVGGIGNIFEGKVEGKLENPESKDIGKKLGLTDQEIANL